MLNMGETELPFQSDLIDLSGIDLEQLDALPDTVFAAALRRILRTDSDDATPYAGFLNDRPEG